MCVLFRDMGKLGKDRVDVMKKIMEYILFHNHKNYNDDSSEVSDIKKVYHSSLMKLGAFALDSLEQKETQIVFTMAEIKENFGPDAFKLGFLKNVPRVSESEPSRVVFHHKLIQEFLQFCCTAEKALPSQMIIPFSAALSPHLKIYLQYELQEILGNWEQKHNINALTRCQFLFALVQEDKESEFDLLTHIHLYLRSYKSATSSTGTIFRNFFQKVSPI